ncbi:hypothetical protein BKA61DRAFT_641921 [Leptodontidium sp. MPI-SDFR-AT-0119]|nr:hypothetical protein BKA61DRAFT_641921 [Leptodontidium sp. MPI-SDFR-AT-0119]
MPKTMENARQDFDELAKKSLCRRLELLVAEKFGKLATWITLMIISGFNNLYRIRVKDFSPDVLVRRSSNTQIPTPRVLFYSNFSNIGPFIIIKHVENKSTLSASVTYALTTPGVDRLITYALDLNISQNILENLYLKQNDLVKLANNCRNKYWLLLNTPEMWDTGIDDWVENYELRLETWLFAMKEAKESAGFESRPTEFPLSAYMRESWETGRFWLTYAGRKTHLLSEGARNAMELFVARKIDKMKERKLAEWDPEAARSRLKEVLLNSEVE